MINDKKVLFSGMQATGNLTLGNYLGALKNWVTISDEYQTFFSVVDMHSITVRQDPAELRRRARNLLTLYIAAGLDPEKNCIYYQSHVSGHAELSWILNCFTYMGELNRMTQFKDKAAQRRGFLVKYAVRSKQALKAEESEISMADEADVLDDAVDYDA